MRPRRHVEGCRNGRYRGIQDGCIERLHKKRHGSQPGKDPLHRVFIVPIRIHRFAAEVIWPLFLTRLSKHSLRYEVGLISTGETVQLSFDEAIVDTAGTRVAPTPIALTKQ